MRYVEQPISFVRSEFIREPAPPPEIVKTAFGTVCFSVTLWWDRRVVVSFVRLERSATSIFIESVVEMVKRRSTKITFVIIQVDFRRSVITVVDMGSERELTGAYRGLKEGVAANAACSSCFRYRSRFLGRCSLRGGY